MEDILNHILEALPVLRYQVGLVALFVVVIVWDLIKGAHAQKSMPYLCMAGLLVGLYLIPEAGELTKLSGIQGIGDHHSFLNYVFGVLAIVIIAFDLVLSNKNRVGEYFSLMIALLLGMSVLIMSKNLLVFYLALETISICSYILTAFKFDKRSSEGALKYILFGAFASAIMLYGISLLYGFSSSLAFDKVFTTQALESNILCQVGLFLTLGGVFFKLSAVPFHIWTPDVYQSAPTPIAAFFSVGPKAAVIYVLSDWVIYLGVNPLFIALISAVAIVSIFYGNLSALKQISLKRMLAYSSIAHAGFLLIATFSSPKEHIHFYISIYLFMNMVAFGLAAWIEKQVGHDRIEAFKGVGLKIPMLGIVSIITMISLAGLPITAGFNAKLLIFIDLWGRYSVSENDWLLALFGFGLVNIVIALFYYLKVPYFMFFGEKSDKSYSLNLGQRLFFIILSFPLLLFFFKPDWLLQFILVLH